MDDKKMGTGGKLFAFIFLPSMFWPESGWPGDESRLLFIFLSSIFLSNLPFDFAKP
jgi:hypothetical protein